MCVFAGLLFAEKWSIMGERVGGRGKKKRREGERERNVTGETDDGAPLPNAGVPADAQAVCV